MTGAALILAAIGLIADEDNWTQDECARNEHLDPVRADACAAKHFDMAGALMKAADLGTKDGAAAYFEAINLIKREISRGLDIYSFNDSHGHAEVLAIMRRAAGAENRKHSSSMSVTSLLKRSSIYRGNARRDAA